MPRDEIQERADVNDDESRQRELRQRLIGGIIAAAIDAIITVDSNQRIVIFNPAAEKVFRISAEEAVGEPLNRFIPERFRGDHRRHVEEFGLTGISIRHAGALGVVRGLRADGSEFPAEVSISQVEVGDEKFYTAIVRDVSEREMAEMAQRRLAAVVENSEDAILTKALNGMITSWNAGAERLFGYAEHEILGRPISQLVPPDRQAEEVQYRERLRHGIGVVGQETVRLDRDGQRIDVSLTLSPLRNPAGEVIGGSSIVRDIRPRIAMQKALEEKERVAHRQLAELNNIYLLAPVALAFIDNELRFRTVNEKMARFSGHSQAELLGQRVRDVMPEMADDLEPLCKRVLETETPVSDVEVSSPPNTDPGGSSRRWLTSYYPIRNSLLWGLNLVVVEPRERGESGSILLRNEKLFLAFASHLPGAAWMKDLTGHYVFVNQEAQRFFGKSRGQIVGKTDEQIFPAETARRFRDNDLRAMADGSREIKTIEKLGQSDGIEHRSMVSVFLVPGNGHPPYVAGVAFDITAQTNAERELSEAREELAADLAGFKRVEEMSKRFVRFDQLPDLLNAVLDAAMSLTGAVKGTILLYHPDTGKLEHLAQRGFDNRSFPLCLKCAEAAGGACGRAHCPETQLIIYDIRESAEVEHAEARRALLAAGVRGMLCNPLHCHVGRLIGMISLHFGSPHQPSKRELSLLDVLSRQSADFIERTQAERLIREAHDQLSRTNAELEHRVLERTAELQGAISELEQMSYSMVHDMRAPLRAIRSFGGIIAAHPENYLTDESRDLLSRIDNSMDRMDELVRGMLTYSQLVWGDLPLEPVALDRIIEKDVDTNAALHSSKAEVEIASDLPAVLGNESTVARIFSQLLDNAVKFAKPGETLKIQIKAERIGNQWVRIVVEDNGVGIAPESLGRIFGIYQRLSNTGIGTGMGLAIVKKAVERMGGRVGAQSQPGVGSRFWVELKQVPQNRIESKPE